MAGIKLHPGGSYNNTGTISGYLYGIYIYGGPGEVTNSGSITATATDGAGVKISGGVGSVANSGTVTASGRAGIGVDLLDGGTLANYLSGTITAEYGVAVEISGGAGTVTNSGAIDSTTGDFENTHRGVELVDGGTVTNVQGGAITANAFGVYIEGGSGTVTNAGTITGYYRVQRFPTGQGVTLRAGGTVSNHLGGKIRGGESVYIYGGSGTVSNAGDLSGVYCGVNLDDGGTVTNAGTISAEVGVTYAGIGVKMGDGGTVINELGGSISVSTGGPSGGEGVDILGAAGAVVNAGAITDAGFTGIGVLLSDGGAVTNETSGTISGADLGAGVVVSAATGKVTNAGAIAGSGPSGPGQPGVSLRAGGSVINQTGGAIAGGPYGVEIYGGAGCVTNAGAISGTTASVEFKGPGANTLTLQTGSTLTGPVYGSTASGATNTLVLQGKGAANINFVDFNALKLQASGSWTLGGASTIGASTLATGTLIVAGPLTTALNQGVGAAVTIDGGDTLTLQGSSALRWAIGGAGTLLLAGGSTAIDGGAEISAANLSITGAGTRAIVAETLGYDDDFFANGLTTLSIGADDSLTLTGTSALSGLVNGPGALDLAGGSTTLSAGARLVEAGWLISGAGTLVTLDEALAYAGAFSESAGSTFDLATGALILTGGADFSGGTVDGGHPLITEGATDVGGLTLGGTVVWTNTNMVTESGGNLTLGDSSGAEAIFSNASTGTYDITDESGVALGASTLSHILNTGLFEKTGGAGTSTIAAEIVNDGTIVAAMGTLDLHGTVAGIGKGQVDAGATLEVDGVVGSGQTINYSGAGGELLLDDLHAGVSNLFLGTTSGFGAGDILDAGAPFGTGTTFNFSENNGGTAGILALTDGSLHAAIHFAGDYSNANFVASSDLNGGTLFIYKS